MQIDPEVSLTPEPANDFHQAHDNVQKPSHEEQPHEKACEEENDQERDDFPSFDAVGHAPSLLEQPENSPYKPLTT